jgi:hypothetical protein
MSDIFGTLQPQHVTAAFATAYVGALSLSNAGGRFAWALASDYLGRPATYYAFGTAIPIAASVPWLTAWAASEPGASAPLALFYGGTCLCVSYYGGLFSVLPAYLSDVFGNRYMGSIHGRVVTAWSVGAMTGPLLMAHLRQVSYSSEAAKLAALVDPALFERTFGAPNDPETLQRLVDAKTVTIARLMDVAPAGTADPTPQLYDTAMYGVCGMLAVAVGANAAIGALGAPQAYVGKRRSRAGAKEEDGRG